MHMVPAIRNILGGFLFSGDDVYKKVGVLSGGERTRLAVARMLLRPSNTLLLDEPTNHLDLDSKDVLLDALEDYGGTLIFVSHDRYFVEKLANRIVEVGHGEAHSYPGALRGVPLEQAGRRGRPDADGPQVAAKAPDRRQDQGRDPAKPASSSRRPGDRRRNRRPAGPDAARDARRSRGEATDADRGAAPRPRAEGAQGASVADLEDRIAACETAIKDLEQAMSAPASTTTASAAQPVVDRHQALMWEVGDLMHQWEELQGRSKVDDGETPDARDSCPAGLTRRFTSAQSSYRPFQPRVQIPALQPRARHLRRRGRFAARPQPGVGGPTERTNVASYRSRNYTIEIARTDDKRQGRS